MGYVRREMYFPRVAEMWEYVDRRYGAPGIKRKARRKATEKEIEAHNQRNKERMCRWKLREHFDENDVFVTLTYEKEKRPADMEECNRDCRRLMDRLRRQYKKAGQVMKWIRNIEVGTRNAWHIHLVIKNIPQIVQIMAKAWQEHGNVMLKPMRADGEFEALAAYMTKTPRTDGRLRESKYSASQNMPVPEPVTKKYQRWQSFEDAEPRLVPKGWHVDKGSIIEGVTRDGFPYRRFQCYPDAAKPQKDKKKPVIVGRRKRLISAKDALAMDPEGPPLMPDIGGQHEKDYDDHLDGFNSSA